MHTRALGVAGRTPAADGTGVAGPDDRWTVAVVIPALDEADLRPRCLHSVIAAAGHVRHLTDVLVVVVADRCVDETAALAARSLAGTWACVVQSTAGNVGHARQLGHTIARTICQSASSERPWLA